MELFFETNEHIITSMALDDARERIILTSASNGDVFQCSTVSTEGELTVRAHIEDLLGGVAVDPASGDLFVTLSFGRSVERLVAGDPEQPYKRTPLFSDGFLGNRFTSPSALAVSPTTGGLFFTDAGGEGESSITNPIGAVYREVSGQPQIVPLCPSGLQQPAGIAVGPDGCVFVCERAANRVLRYVPRGNHYVDSVFCRFQGTLGPTAVAVSPKDGTLFIALYEPTALSEAFKPSSPDGEGEVGEPSDSPEGTVVVMGRDGQKKGAIGVPCSQLRSLAVSQDGSKVYILHTDEATSVSRIYRCTISEGNA